MQQSLKLRDLINMTNGVLGLAILAMPFCFAQVNLTQNYFSSSLAQIRNLNIFKKSKKAGILLASLTLLTCAILTSFSCRLLIKTVEIKKIRTMEYLALRILGHKAKVLLEIT
jgi:hypothetical protein